MVEVVLKADNQLFSSEVGIENDCGPMLDRVGQTVFTSHEVP